jgi:hypothetical protein
VFLFASSCKKEGAKGPPSEAEDTGQLPAPTGQPAPVTTSTVTSSDEDPAAEGDPDELTDTATATATQVSWTCPHPGTWQVVDDFNLADTQHSFGKKLLAGADSKLWLVGSASSEVNRSRLLTRVSTDHGATWTSSDLYEGFGSTYNTYGYALAQTSDGWLYVAGAGQGPEPRQTNENALIRRSATGETWALADNYQLVRAHSTFAFGVGVAESDIVWWAGSGEDENGVTHMLVTRMDDAKQYWVNVVTDFTIADGKASYATGLTVGAASRVYVTGAAKDAGDVKHWIVRRSADGGTTWTTLDDFSLVTGKEAEAGKLVEAEDGTLYVVGIGLDADDHYRWVVRKSSNDGASWTTVDDYEYGPVHGYTFPHDIMVDRDGTVWTVGEATDDLNYKHWIVRKSSDGGATWSVMDDWRYHAATSSLAHGVARDADGVLYVTGNAKDYYFGTNHLIVRRYCE